jgi:hypothetical protein
VEAILYAVVAAALGALGMWLAHRGLKERFVDLKAEKDYSHSQILELQGQLATETALVATLEERARRIPELEQELSGYQAAREENARLLHALNL